MSNEQLALDYQHGDQDALEPLWDQVRALAFTICSSYREALRLNAAVDLEDLLQAAFLGVEAAARTFDAGRGAFAGHASHIIRNKCREALGLRGQPRLEHYRTSSMDAPLLEGEDLTRHDVVSDPMAEDVDACLLEDDMAGIVRRAVGSLPQDQAEAVARHWLAGESYKEIMDATGLTRGRVQYLFKKDLRALSKDHSLRELAEAYCCWRHVSLETFKTTLTSVTEAVALWLVERNLSR